MLSAVAFVALGLAAARPSAIALRLGRVGRVTAAGSRSAWPRGGRHGHAKASIHARGIAALATMSLALLSGLAPLAPALGYVTFVAPGILADRRQARELRSAERALGVAIEWADALVSIGQPAERAFAAAARHGTGAPRLDPVLRDASAAAALGAPLFRALAAEARGAGLTELGDLAAELDRTRDLGRGSRAVLREARDALRRQERTRHLEAAAKVETKMMLVLVACYLPALMLVVVVPLFVGLLGGLLE